MIDAQQGIDAYSFGVAVVHTIAFVTDYTGPGVLDRAIRDNITSVKKWMRDIGLSQVSG